MAIVDDCPLGDEHCAKLDRILELNARQRELLEKCVDCFPRLKEFEAENEEMGRIAAALKARFFPNRK